jgi:hypothetical protein
MFVCIALRLQKTSIICFCIALHLQIHKVRQQHTSYILQQILDLKRLQITDGSNLSPLIHDQEQLDISSSIHAPEKFDENIDQHVQHSQDLSTDLQQMDDSHQELKADTLPFTFSQQEHLPSSPNTGLPLHGESFWQYKSPVQSSQV